MGIGGLLLDDNIKTINMIVEFSKRIKALRRDLIDAIIAELHKYGVTSFELPENLEKCQRPWQICTDINGEPQECFVSKIAICGCDNDHLRIYANNGYDSYVTWTSCDYEAKDIEFLYNLFRDLQYFLKETNSK
jgi:hypothetical protein